MSQGHAAVPQHPSVHPSTPGPGPSGQAAEFQGTREAAGPCLLLVWSLRGVRREAAARDSWPWAPHCLSAVNVPRCNADEHEMLGRTEGWLTSSSPTTSPVQSGALTLAGEPSLTFPPCSSWQRRAFVCLFLMFTQTPAKTTALECHWASSSHHLGVKGAPSDNSSAQLKQQLCSL